MRPSITNPLLNPSTLDGVTYRGGDMRVGQINTRVFVFCNFAMEYKSYQNERGSGIGFRLVRRKILKNKG